MQFHGKPSSTKSLSGPLLELIGRLTALVRSANCNQTIPPFFNLKIRDTLPILGGGRGGGANSGGQILKILGLENYREDVYLCGERSWRIR